MFTMDYLSTINKNRTQIKRNSNFIGLIITFIYAISGFLLLTYETTCSGTQPNFNIGLSLLIDLLIPALFAIYIGEHELRQLNQFIDITRVLLVWNLSSLGILILSYFFLGSLGSQFNSILDSIYVGSLAGLVFYIFFGMAIFIGILSFIRNRWDIQKYSDYLPYETKISVLLDILLTNLSLSGKNKVDLEELSSYLNVQPETLHEILEEKINRTIIVQGFDTNTGEVLFGKANTN